MFVCVCRGILNFGWIGAIVSYCSSGYLPLFPPPPDLLDLSGLWGPLPLLRILLGRIHTLSGVAFS